MSRPFLRTPASQSWCKAHIPHKSRMPHDPVKPGYDALLEECGLTWHSTQADLLMHILDWVSSTTQLPEQRVFAGSRLQNRRLTATKHNAPVIRLVDRATVILTCFYRIYPPPQHRESLIRIHGAKQGLDRWEDKPVNLHDLGIREVLRVDYPSRRDLEAAIATEKSTIQQQKTPAFQRWESRIKETSKLNWTVSLGLPPLLLHHANTGYINLVVLPAKDATGNIIVMHEHSFISPRSSQTGNQKSESCSQTRFGSSGDAFKTFH
ncbi:uncharacterized protein BO66DRAFT_441821 [Aspergillus aculeatinus CBS 121060]|uniref:Uncharacterized protein n=1 Tax=Aspergillus aculeatinus CBS 121060 TaxID=1448322 RepID=A0ACD1GZT4_9EURO|nr:hypothetical protein BO66DRAFT_441821 [Aspergillus aculeatinus CBS 121060]RAH66696.1 hypothetical protein BO66DRAFT_441821 [Aspergillus aculeatinus CBS 121060]